ncbi:hypothetical protein MTO96_014349 [Rhipicephalus appendiculatus]
MSERPFSESNRPAAKPGAGGENRGALAPEDRGPGDIAPPVTCGRRATVEEEGGVIAVQTPAGSFIRRRRRASCVYNAPSVYASARARTNAMARRFMDVPCIARTTRFTSSPLGPRAKNHDGQQRLFYVRGGGVPGLKPRIRSIWLGLFLN